MFEQKIEDMFKMTEFQSIANPRKAHPVDVACRICGSFWPSDRMSWSRAGLKVDRPLARTASFCDCGVFTPSETSEHIYLFEEFYIRAYLKRLTERVCSRFNVTSEAPSPARVGSTAAD